MRACFQVGILGGGGGVRSGSGIQALGATVIIDKSRYQLSVVRGELHAFVPNLIHSYTTIDSSRVEVRLYLVEAKKNEIVL